jgi:hypothetical protein
MSNNKSDCQRNSIEAFLRKVLENFSISKYLITCTVGSDLATEPKLSKKSDPEETVADL